MSEPQERWDRMVDDLAGALRDIPDDAMATLDERTRGAIGHILAIHKSKQENGEAK
jgi:hypothetical protein